MKFFVGWHHPGRVDQVGRPCMLSANALRDRVSNLPLCDGDRWMLDSGAFSQVSGEAGFYESPAEYAITIERWSRCGKLVAAVTQDYMCEPHILDRLKRNAKQQQMRSIKRYSKIRDQLDRLNSDVHLMPVLQGWSVRHYRRHLRMYNLPEGCWTGVGSVCKRNASPADVERIILAIKEERPDLRLHGFGIKKTALQRPAVREMLYSADSMAWSLSERKNGGDPNDPQAAREFFDALTEEKTNTPLFQDA